MKLPKFLFMLIAILFCISTSIRAATNSKKSSKVEKVFVIIEKYDSVNAVKFEAKEKILFINVWDPVIFVQQKKEYYNKILRNIFISVGTTLIVTAIFFAYTKTSMLGFLFGSVLFIYLVRKIKY